MILADILLQFLPLVVVITLGYIGYIQHRIIITKTFNDFIKKDSSLNDFIKHVDKTYSRILEDNLSIVNKIALLQDEIQQAQYNAIEKANQYTDEKLAKSKKTTKEKKPKSE